MDIEKIKEAYSSGNDEELCKELASFHLMLINQVYLFGPAVVALQFRGGSFLLAILNKISARDEDPVAERLAYQAGAVSTYLSYFQDIASRQKVDEADARLSGLPVQGDQANLVRTMILKSACCEAGERPKELMDAIARCAKVKKSLVKVHLRELLEMGLVERIVWARRIISYRITHLGEAILSRRSKPHDLALFCVDMAAFDPELRAAMKDEIKSTWPSDER